MQWRLVYAVGLLLGSGGANAQSEIYGNTDLVTVCIGVTDQNGHVIEDLNTGDFAVTEDGKTQKVWTLLFRKLDIDEPLPEIPATHPAATAAAAWPPPDKLEHRRLLAMLFDFSAMATPDQASVRESAVNFIRHGMKPADLVIVMAQTSGHMEVLQDVTDDRAALEAAVMRVDAGIANLESAVLNASRKLTTIETACRRLSSMPLLGNKALLYFAERFPLEAGYNRTALANIANACGRANTAIYPIRAANDSLTRLVAATGGSIFPRGSDMTSSIKLARDNIGSHYVLGYFSTNMRDDGGYRSVNVNLTRSGARLDYPHGYFANSYFWSFRR